MRLSDGADNKVGAKRRFSSRIAIVIAMALPWTLTTGFSPPNDPTRWSDRQWEGWRDSRIAWILSSTLAVDGTSLLDRSEVSRRSGDAYAWIAPYLAQPGFLSEGNRARILGNFARFITAEHWATSADSAGVHDHALGLAIDDAAYWRHAQPYTSLPKLLQSDAVLELLAHRQTYREAVARILDANRDRRPGQRWQVLLFRGQFVLSVDRTTYARLLVVAPNQPLGDGTMLDQWISFAIAGPDSAPNLSARSVSVVAVVHDPCGRRRSRAYFTDFLRLGIGVDGHESVEPTFLMRPNPSQNCYECHKSAVLPIRPRATYRFGGDGTLVDSGPQTDLLRRLDVIAASYGSTDLVDTDCVGYGPSMGALPSGPVDELVTRWTADQPIGAASYPRVESAMRCASCHAKFASLNYGLAIRTDGEVKSFEARKGLVQSYIEQGMMPPGNDLSREERHALWECVSKAYYDPEREAGAFVDWLRGCAAG